MAETFIHRNLSGASFRDCNLSNAKISASLVDGLRVEPHAGDPAVVFVNGVDVSPYVAEQLDLRFPERVQVREATTVAGIRAAWSTLGDRWAETLERAAALSEEQRHERVEDEWSFVETLRHLVFAIDTWMGRMIRGEELPYHPLGLPPSDEPPERYPELGLDPSADPAYDEVLAALADRRSQVDDLLAVVTDDQLDEVRSAVLSPQWGEESVPVRECLRVVLYELCEHRRFAVRDLAVIEGR